MYRYLVATLMLVVFVILVEPAKTLMSSLLHLDQPIKHQVEEGDWFSKLAQKYYGDSSFGKELALLNRAPDRDLLFPGEEIMIPSFEKIQKVRATRKLSVVNAIANEQAELAGHDIQTVPRKIETERAEPLEETTIEPEPIPVSGVPTQNDGSNEPLEEAYLIDEDSETESAGFFLGGIILFVIAFGAGIVFWLRKKREKEDVEIYGASGDEQEEKHATSIYFDGFETHDNEDETATNGKKESEKAELVV